MHQWSPEDCDPDNDDLEEASISDYERSDAEKAPVNANVNISDDDDDHDDDDDDVDDDDDEHDNLVDHLDAIDQEVVQEHVPEHVVPPVDVSCNALGLIFNDIN